MTDVPVTDYTALDKPEILRNIFFPRPEWKNIETDRAKDIMIPVEGDISVGARFHLVDEEGHVFFFSMETGRS